MLTYDRETAEVFAKNQVRFPTVIAAATAMGIPPPTYYNALKRLKILFPEIFERRFSVSILDATKSKTIICTSAQISTGIHKGFWNNLLAYAQHKRAKIFISPFSYNINNRVPSRKPGTATIKTPDWWPDEIEPYLESRRVKIADDLYFCAELNMLPTAVSPIAGMETYTKQSSAILPHAKIAAQSFPASLNKTKMIYTTGTVSERNYIQARAGQKAEFHHVFGASIIEKSKAGWQVRQINAEESGAFYDLQNYVSNGRVRGVGDSIWGLNLGDVHWGLLANRNKSLIDKTINDLKPKHIFLHDLFDGSAISHHRLKRRIARRKSSSPVDELRGIAVFLADIARRGIRPIVVYSNHDHWIYRWLELYDWRAIYSDGDKEEARFYLSLAQKFLEQEDRFIPLREALSLCGSGTDCKFLDEDESFIYNGIEFGAHGHHGINGARGSVSSYRKMGAKVNMGHTHSASIVDGVYCAGTSTQKRLGYNKGPSSWSLTHIITYKNGARTLYTLEL